MAQPSRCEDENLTPCRYCGMPADSIDHVIPQSLVSAARCSGHPEWAREIVKARIETVPSCRQCNAVLGDRVFPTVADRKAAVKAYLRRKYRKLLSAPAWTPEQSGVLGPRLRQFVQNQQAIREEVEARLRW